MIMNKSTTIPLSIRIDSKLKITLDKVAKSDNSSTSSLLIEVIEKYVEARKNKEILIQNSLQEADKWEFISHDKMREWFASLWSSNELAFPDPNIFTKNK